MRDFFFLFAVPIAAMLWLQWTARNANSMLVAPIAYYPEKFTYHGHQSTRHVITVPFTSEMPEGVLNGGNFEVTLKAQGPIYAYRLQTISYVPSYHNKITAFAEIVPSLDAYNTTFGSLDPISTQPLQNGITATTLRHNSRREATRYHPEHHEFVKREVLFHAPEHVVLAHFQNKSINNPNRRKLKFLDLAIGAAALAIGIENTMEIHHIKGQISELKDKQAADHNAIVNLQAADVEIKDSISKTNQALIITQNQVAEVTVGLDQLQQTFDKQSAFDARAIDTLNVLQKSAAADIGDIYGKLGDIGEQMNIQAQQYNNALAALAQSMGDQMLSYSRITDQRISQVQRDQLDSDGRTLAFLSLFQDQLDNLALSQGLTQAKFRAASLIPPGMFQLCVDPGLRPDDTALTGRLLRVLIDSFDVTYAIDSPPTPTRQAVVSTFSWFMESHYAMNNVKPFSTVVSLMTGLGPRKCKRPFWDSSVPGSSFETTTNDLPVCDLWLEETTFVCDTIDPTFEWGSRTTSALDDSICVKNSLVASKRAVYLTLDAINTRLGDVYSIKSLAPSAQYFFIGSLRLGKQIRVIAPKVASDAYLDPTTANNNLNYMTLNSWMSWMLAYVYKFTNKGTGNSVQEDVKNLQLLVYGRSPDNTYDYPLASKHVPTINDTNGNPAPNEGAKPTQIWASEFYWVSSVSVPLQAAVPRDVKPSSARVDVTTVTRVAGSSDLPVTTHDIQDFLQFTAEAAHEVPPYFLIMGSVNATEGLIYNIPQSLMCASNDEDACFKKIGFYYCDSSATCSLAEYQAKNNNRYHPSKMPPNPGKYARLVFRDEEGFPMCVESGSIPQDELIRGTVADPTVPACAGTFSWFNASATPQTFYCNGVKDGGRVWYQDRQTFNSFDSTGVDLTANWAMSCVYRTTVDPLTILTLSDKNGVSLQITGGHSINVAFGNSQTVDVSVYHDTSSPGAIHGVWVQWTAVGALLEIYVDMIRIYSQSNFNFVPNNNRVTDPHLKVFDTDRTPGLGAEVFLFKFYPAIRTADAVVASMACHVSLAPTARCDAPQVPAQDDSGEVGFADTRRVVTAYQTPDCTVSDSVFIATTSGVDFIANKDWAISFWTDHLTLGSEPTVLLDFGPTIGWKFAIIQTPGFFPTVQFISGDQVLTSLLQATPELVPLRAYQYLLIKQDDGIHIYINTRRVTVMAGIAFTNDAPDIRSQFRFHPQVTMGRFYPNGLSTDDDTVSKVIKCEVGPNNDVQHWRTPLASCVVGELDPHSAYCRHPNLCRGNCQAFTTNLNAGTFSVSSLVCDPGYTGPNCSVTCTDRTANGYCADRLPVPDKFFNVTGVIPDGQWCTILKHFRVWEGVEDGVRMLYLQPRHWTILATIKVPQGDNLVAELSAGVCPKIDPVPVNNKTIAFKLTSTNGQDTTVRVEWFNTNPQDIDKRCLDKYGAGDDGTYHEDYLVKGNFPRTFTSPPCKNTKIQVSILDFTDANNPVPLPCGDPIDSTVFPEIIQTAKDWPDDLVNVVTVVTDQVQTAANRAMLLAYESSVRMQINAAKGSAAQAMIDAMTKYLASLSNITVSNVPINVTELEHKPVDIGGPSFDELMRQLAANADAVSKLDIKEEIKNIRSEAVNVSKLVNDSNAHLAQAQAYLDKALQWIKIAENITVDDNMDFWGSVEAIASKAADAAAKTANAAAGGIKWVADAMGSIFGAGSALANFFTGLISSIIYIAVILAIIWVAWTLWGWYQESRDKKAIRDLSKQAAAYGAQAHEMAPLVADKVLSKEPVGGRSRRR